MDGTEDTTRKIQHTLPFVLKRDAALDIGYDRLVEFVPQSNLHGDVHVTSLSGERCSFRILATIRLLRKRIPVSLLV
jgi:hypothetical protein